MSKTSPAQVESLGLTRLTSQRFSIGCKICSNMVKLTVSSLWCEACGHVWQTNRYVYKGRELKTFVKTRNNGVVRCPGCKDCRFVKIGKKMNDTPWMDWLIKYIGEAEITGRPPTDFDKLVFSHTSYGELNDSLPPSCAATACAALELCGFKSPHDARALAFESYGDPLNKAIYGAICVFQFGSGHHVSFYEKDAGDGFIECLGGNQGHYLKRAVFPLADVIAMRWPVK